MSNHTADEIRKKRLARLELGSHSNLSTEDGESASQRAHVENGGEFDVEMSSLPYESRVAIISNVPSAGAKTNLCDTITSETHSSQINCDTSLNFDATDNYYSNLLSMMLRVLSVCYEEQPSNTPFCHESENNVLIKIHSETVQQNPEDLSDIRCYKSICFDLLSSSLAQIRSACSDASKPCIKIAALSQYLQIEYLSNCIYKLREEKERSCLAKSADVTRSLQLDLLHEIGCQLHRHIRLILQGVFSSYCADGPTHVPNDPWLNYELTDSPLIRLVVPGILPSYTSMWALASVSALKQPLDSVIVSGRLEPPLGSDEVMCNLLGELQMEMTIASSGMIDTGPIGGKRPLQQIFEQLLMNMHFRIRELAIDRHEYGQILCALVSLCNTCLVDGSRPINQLIVRLPCWSTPTTLTNLPVDGRSIERLSFLGPFFAASVFADDDPTVVETAFPNSRMTDSELQHTTQSLQLSYDLVWNQQFALIKSLLTKVNTPSYSHD
ncbi:hypothetical protein AHF37_05142 [Paragonimus kellicotti]|nr:hypothetical protein AHF37_05142 [Paragonimus kellicotti]